MTVVWIKCDLRVSLLHDLLHTTLEIWGIKEQSIPNSPISPNPAAAGPIQILITVFAPRSDAVVAIKVYPREFGFPWAYGLCFNRRGYEELQLVDNVLFLERGRPPL